MLINKDLILLKWMYFLKLYRFNAIAIKIPICFFLQNQNWTKHMEMQRTQNQSDALRKEQSRKMLTLPKFKTYYITTVIIKRVWYSLIGRQWSMKYKWEATNKPLHLWATDFWHGFQDNPKRKEFTSKNGASTMDYPHTKWWS